MTRRNEVKDITLGVVLLLLAHIVAFYLVLGLGFLIEVIIIYISNHFLKYKTTNYLVFYILFNPGLTQLIYVIPGCYWLKRKERIAVMKGVIIVAIMTALLNGGCWLLIMSN